MIAISPGKKEISADATNWEGSCDLESKSLPGQICA
jgi:hypothetical protein